MEDELGSVTHFYSHLSVAVVKLNKDIKVGDEIRVKGHTTDFTQKVESMQIDHKEVEEAKKGQEIGLKLADRVREHDKLFK